METTDPDLAPLKKSLGRYLLYCQMLHWLNCVLPMEKLIDLVRHVLGLIRKHTRHLR